MSKSVMSGGYTAQEARNLLLIRGVEHVKGIVPHNVPKNANMGEFDDLPQFWLDNTIRGDACTYNFEQSRYTVHGQMTLAYIRLDMRLCWNCSHAIFDYLKSLSPTLSFISNVHQHYCELCGKWEIDDIPF